MKITALVLTVNALLTGSLGSIAIAAPHHALPVLLDKSFPNINNQELHCLSYVMGLPMLFYSLLSLDFALNLDRSKIRWAGFANLFIAFCTLSVLNPITIYLCIVHGLSAFFFLFSEWGYKKSRSYRAYFDTGKTISWMLWINIFVQFGFGLLFLTMMRNSISLFVHPEYQKATKLDDEKTLCTFAGAYFGSVGMLLFSIANNVNFSNTMTVSLSHLIYTISTIYYMYQYPANRTIGSWVCLTYDTYYFLYLFFAAFRVKDHISKKNYVRKGMGSLEARAKV